MANFGSVLGNRMSEDRGLRNWLVITIILLLTLLFTLPILPEIPVHPDEYQFFANAWSIMSGQALQNYLHVAFTEYFLTGFLLIMNLITPSGVNFPQGSPSLTTIYYGRFFGLLLYLITYALGCVIVQKGEKEVKPRTVIFTVIYFASLGIFERFLRVNSDATMVFLFANYFVVSFLMHRHRLSLYHFFLVNSLFLFLFSFTNLKALFLALPLFLLNTLAPLIWYSDSSSEGEFVELPRFYWVAAQAIFLVNLVFIGFLVLTNFRGLYLAVPVFVLNSLNPYLWIYRKRGSHESVFLKLYKLIIYGLSALGVTVLLWYFLMPRPFDTRRFWYGLKNTLVLATQFDYDYPGQSHRSWLVYIYDLLVEYVGLVTAAIALLLILVGLKLKGRILLSDWFSSLRMRLTAPFWREGNYYPLTEAVLLSCFLAYYLGVSSRVVHWSRWGLPLGFTALILMSLVLEKVLVEIYQRWQVSLIWFSSTMIVLSLIVLSPRFLLALDIQANGFPYLDGHKLTYADVDRFLREVGIPTSEATQSAVWFTGPTRNTGNISLEKLTEMGYEKASYLLWPQWNLGVVYTKSNVDKSTHNQRAFIDKYTTAVNYRYPSLSSRYTHAVKYFAWTYLGITYTPELESLIEPQYAVLKLRENLSSVNYKYTIGFDDMSHYFLPKSSVFNINNLPEGYMFPPCYSNPAVFYVSDGALVDPDPQTGSRILGLHCHSIRFRVGFKGIYAIRIEGLPPDLNGSQKVYSAYNYRWDPIERLITFVAPQTFISVEFGVATQESAIPQLKYHVYYRSLTADEEKSIKAQPIDQ